MRSGRTALDLTRFQWTPLPKTHPCGPDTRATPHSTTLADLYVPELMPPNLRRAHQVLDRAVDQLYRRAPFAFERQRVEHSFALYEKMRAPLELPVTRQIATILERHASRAQKRSRICSATP